MCQFVYLQNLKLKEPRIRTGLYIWKKADGMMCDQHKSDGYHIAHT